MTIQQSQRLAAIVYAHVPKELYRAASAGDGEAC